MANSDFLQHHGILGMKWGRRRYQNPDGSLTEAGRKRYGRLKRRQQIKYDSENRWGLSVNDLRSKIERINLERQLKDLSDKELTPGRKATSDILSSSGKRVLSGFLTGTGFYLAKAAITRKFDVEELASYVAKKG